MEITSTISKLLTGTPQSQYAAIAIIIAIIAIILSILFNENDLSLNERFMLIGSVLLFSIPSIILGLFDLTCVAGKTVENSVCWWWGWVIAAIIIIICVIVVFASISSMLTYNVATTKNMKPVIDEVESNKIAKKIIEKENSIEQVKPKVEQPLQSDMFMHQDMQGNNMGSNLIEQFKSRKKESFKQDKTPKPSSLNTESFSNFNIEGFQGCEYQAVDNQEV
jgi:hypothetical protein